MQSSCVQAILWQDHALHLLDQRVLPTAVSWLRYDTVGEVARAINQMVVRGAPAIGIAAAYGVVLATRARYAAHRECWRQTIGEDLECLAQSRPTAVNLFWALREMQGVIDQVPAGIDPEAALLEQARKLHSDDLQANLQMGVYGADYLAATADHRRHVLTHCNAGALATGGFGTALGVIRTAWQRGLIERVYADETRPWFQGARLTAWELLQDGIAVTLNTEGAAASLMRSGGLGWVIVGADRIAANGDVANNIGTYGLAVLARHHGVKMVVAAPVSTFDLNCPSGVQIPIECRDGREITDFLGQRIAATDVQVHNPVFDVTPADLVDAIITERGVIEKPDAGKVERICLL
jgi:methylthioribose-1-phosphate isomerase